MSSYNTRSRLYTVDYRIKGEKDKIGPTTQRMKKNNKNEECTGDSGALRTLAQPDIPTFTTSANHLYKS